MVGSRTRIQVVLENPELTPGPSTMPTRCLASLASLVDLMAGVGGSSPSARIRAGVGGKLR